MSRAGDGLMAGAVAGVVSGVPSTVHALATGRPVLGAARAAGALLGRPTLARGAAAHTAISLAWGVVLAAVLPRRGTVWAGALAGVAIAGLDLGLVGRRYPEIRSLPQGPQVLDHVAFGAAVGAVLAAGANVPTLRRSRRAPQPLRPRARTG